MKRLLSAAMLFLAAVMAYAAPAPARAADYPSKTITMICPFGAGSGADIIIRPLIPYMKEALGTEVVMDYKAGAAGIVGANFFMTTRPDGYTLLTYNQPHILLQERFMKTAYDTDAFVPLLAVTFRPDHILVNKNGRFKSVDDIIAYARANPGKLTVGTVGVYSGNHLTYALLEREWDKLGIRMTRVPFESGGKMISALIGEQVDMALSGITWTANYEDVISLASCTEEQEVEGIPTLKSMGYDVYGSYTSNYIFAHRKAPKEVIDFLCERLATLKGNEALKADLVKSGVEPTIFTAEEAEALNAQFIRNIDSVSDLLQKKN